MKNHLIDSLVVSASTFICPLPPKLTYEVQVKNRPSLPNNVKYQKVFEDDDEINRFLQVIDEFSEMHIDQENETIKECNQSKLKDEIGQITLFSCLVTIYPKDWFL